MWTDSLPGDDSFSFRKNLTLCIIFFTVTPFTLITSIFALFSMSKTAKAESAPVPLSYRSQISNSGVKVFASLPDTVPAVGAEITAQDARSEIVRQYLNAYGSLLEPYAGLIIATADKYGLDFRLITAIAQQESNLCKIIPSGTHNCWGWGIHSEGTLGFSSYEEAIETVSQGLKENYIDKGYVTPDEIMKKYTPMSNGSWANGVNKFMSEME